MLSRVKLCLGAAAVAAAVTMSAGAFAATVDLSFDRFERSGLAAARATRASYESGLKLKGVETFNGYKAWDGTSGTSQPAEHQGRQLHLLRRGGQRPVGGRRRLEAAGARDDDMPWGRYGTAPDLPLGGNWLDSNDNLGMRWEIAGSASSTPSPSSCSTPPTSAASSRSRSGTRSTRTSPAPPASSRTATSSFVKIMLSEAVTNLTVELMHDRTNDGFGIDGAAVGLAPVPLPPAALLLGTASLGLVGFGRRRAATA